MVQKNGHVPGGLGFITPTVVAVLELFVREPLQQFHEREVVRRTDVSKGSANKILRLLADIGVLRRERKGRMVFYGLDLRDPFARQFKVLENVYSLRTLTNRLRSHAKKVVLFGSCAQGTDVRSSDIDVFVLTGEKDLVREKISEFNKKSERRIAPIVVDSSEFVRLRRDDKALYENVERGIVLWQAE
jgi:predicted nucleotidyltransferase